MGFNSAFKGLMILKQQNLQTCSLDTYIISNEQVRAFGLFSVVNHILSFTDEEKYSLLCGNYLYPFF